MQIPDTSPELLKGWERVANSQSPLAMNSPTPWEAAGELYSHTLPMKHGNFLSNYTSYMSVFI